MEFTQTIGVGVADLQHAALAETRRLMREAGGDRRVAAGLMLDRLQELGLVTATERDVLHRMHAIGAESSDRTDRTVRGQGAAEPAVTKAYLEVRDLYDAMLVRGDASPVALALAAGAVGSYEAVEGDGGTVVLAKSNRHYQGLLGSAGAVIGGAIGGSAGAAIGGTIGGVIGAIVDDCKD